jgi:hypothetical protein
MNPRHFAIVAASFAAVALGTGACTQPAETQPDTVTHTVVETRDVPGPPVVIERQTPPVVIVDGNGRPADQNSTTIRADQNGISVEARR